MLLYLLILRLAGYKCCPPLGGTGNTVNVLLVRDFCVCGYTVMDNVVMTTEMVKLLGTCQCASLT